MTEILLAHGGGGTGGSTLASWTPLWVTMAVYAAIASAAFAYGRPRGGLLAHLARIPDGLERFTRIPGWAVAAAGTALYGVLVAGIGFYSDVAWHIALGRDEELFTAPHAMIVLGLGMIAGGAVLGIAFASLSRAEVGFRVGRFRVPWSMIPLGALGLAALSGFPLDELWHQAYGIDVTMWSPTHMLMILGASFTPMAAWFALGESGVGPRDGGWARFAHALAAWLTLQGLAASQGEFTFGVPQFQQLFHPVLVMIAGGFALAAIRLVHGRFWALGIAGFFFLFDMSGLPGLDGGPVEMRSGGIYLATAAAIELAAWLVGTENRRRYALAAGVGTATLGLAGEWVWNLGSHQPWTTSLLPDAAVLGVMAALGSAVLGTAFADALRRRRTPLRTPTLIVAGIAVLFTLAWPMPRPTGDVRAAIEVTPAGSDEAYVSVTLSPPEAANDARWFQAISWQGGDLHLAEMRRTGPGEYVSVEPVQVTGNAKSMLRLHRGAEMMAVPVYLPEDEETGEPEIPAADRTVAFVTERDYLMRETHEGPSWFAPIIYGLLALAGAAWVTAFVVAGRRITLQRPAEVERAEKVPVG